MELLVDIGNTDVVLGFYADGEWKALLRQPTHQAWTAQKVEQCLRQHWVENAIASIKPQACLLSCVVPSVRPQWQKGLSQWLGFEVEVLGPQMYSKLPIEVISPEEIGTDLVANAMYAHHQFNTKVLVVDFGTALTFTLVDQSGRIEGVSIAPGLKTAVKSLFSQTAQLPEVPLEMPTKPLGTDTVSAIQSGILWGYVGMVKEMIAQVKALNTGPVQVLATGGLSSILTPLQDHFDVVDKRITLEGLRLILNRLPR